MTYTFFVRLLRQKFSYSFCLKEYFQKSVGFPTGKVTGGYGIGKLLQFVYYTQINKTPKMKVKRRSHALTLINWVEKCLFSASVISLFQTLCLEAVISGICN